MQAKGVDISLTTQASGIYLGETLTEDVNTVFSEILENLSSLKSSLNGTNSVQGFVEDALIVFGEPIANSNKSEIINTIVRLETTIERIHSNLPGIILEEKNEQKEKANDFKYREITNLNNDITFLNVEKLSFLNPLNTVKWTNRDAGIKAIDKQIGNISSDIEKLKEEIRLIDAL